MPNSIKNRARTLHQITLSTQVKRYSSSLLVILSLSACANFTPAKAPESSMLGKLAALESVSVFVDSSLSRQVASPPSHGIVLSESSPFRILLSSGKIAWAKTTPTALPVLVTLDSTQANLSNLPQSDLDKPSFQWLDTKVGRAFTIVGATQDINAETPVYIEKQGRKIATQQAYSFPQLQVADKDGSAWVSFQHLELHMPEKNEISSSGLLQKPFISLRKNNLTLSEKPNSYLDVTSSDIERLPIPNKDWAIEQRIDLSTNKDAAIKSLELASSEHNCNIIFIQWKTLKTDGFGFCKEAEMAATPFILSYGTDISSKSIIITLLEITGDDEVKRQYLISHDGSTEEPIRLLGE